MERVMNLLGYRSDNQIRELVEQAVAKALSDKDEELFSELVKRGGSATIQINPKSGTLPRVRFT